MTNKDKCPICGRSWEEYDISWSCRRFHNWQKSWRVDKKSEKYKQYLEKRNLSMQIAARKRLEKLNKQTPKKYKSRNI